MSYTSMPPHHAQPTSSPTGSSSPSCTCSGAQWLIQARLWLEQVANVAKDNTEGVRMGKEKLTKELLEQLGPHCKALSFIFLCTPRTARSLGRRNAAALRPALRARYESNPLPNQLNSKYFAGSRLVRYAARVTAGAAARVRSASARARHTRGAAAPRRAPRGSFLLAPSPF